MDIQYKTAVNDSNVSANDVAFWIRSICFLMSAEDAMSLANKMKAGATWTPPVFVPEWAPPFITIVEAVDIDEVIAKKNKMTLVELAEAGANGDAAAAAEVCQRLLAGWEGK